MVLAWLIDTRLGLRVAQLIKHTQTNVYMKQQTVSIKKMRSNKLYLYKISLYFCKIIVKSFYFPTSIGPTLFW